MLRAINRQQDLARLTCSRRNRVNLRVESRDCNQHGAGRVIDDLVEFGLARVVATFRPLVTFKKAQAKESRDGTKRRKSWKEDRR